VLLDPNNSVSGLLASENDLPVTINGVTRTAHQWLAHREIRKRAGEDGNIVFLLHKLGERDAYFTALSKLVDRLRTMSPHPSPFLLSGGCAIAQREAIMRLELDIGFVEDTELTGLEGVYMAAQRQRMGRNLFAFPDEEGSFDGPVQHL
jgi:hypothetical protein